MLFLILYRNIRAEELDIPHFNDKKLNNKVRSLVLIDEGIDALESNNRQKAYEFFNQAKGLSPDLPQVYFYLAKFHFSLSSEGILTFLSYINKMFSAIFRDFWWSFYFFCFITTSLVLTIYISTVGFSSVITYSKFPLFWHDIGEERKHLLLLTPSLILMFAGPLFALLALLLPSWIYLDKRQKIVSLFYTFLVGVLIMLLPAISVFSTLPNYQSFKDIVTISEGENTGFEFQSLKNDTRWQSLFSQAIALKRKGDCEKAISIYENLLEKSEDPRYYNNLGNCYAINSDLKTAMSYYKKAFDIRKSAPLLYNMSQILREELEFKEAELYYGWAKQMEPLLIPPLSNDKKEVKKGLFVIDERLTQTELWDLAFDIAGNYTTTPYIKRSLSSLSIIPSFFLLIGICILLIWSSSYRKSGTYQCRRCGNSYCPSCEKRVFTHSKQFSEDVCVTCFKTLVRLEELEPKKRVERILSIQKYKNSRSKKFKLLEMLIPGTGHLYFERTFYGVTISFLYFYFLCLFILTLVITPFPSTALSSTLFRWTAIICFIIIYCFSLINIYRRPYRGWL